jgi:hypothetical protein
MGFFLFKMLNIAHHLTLYTYDEEDIDWLLLFRFLFWGFLAGKGFPSSFYYSRFYQGIPSGLKLKDYQPESVLYAAC